MSGLINKVKEKMAELKGDSTHSGSTNAGPHSSNLANQADPRVDSNLDGRADGLGHNTTGTGITGTSGMGSSGANTTYTGNTSNTTTGPHSSSIANKLDPRVDSNTTGYSGSNTTQSTGTTGTGLFGNNTTSGTTNTSNYSGSGATTTAGPHNSDMLNKLDPRIDSDLSGGHPGSNAAYTGTGTTGYSSNTGSTGHTGSSGMFGSSNTTGYSGNTANTTAGPHNSDLLNKLDPRVDSDMSGSRTGANSAYTTTGPSGNTGISSNSGYNSGNISSGPHSSNIANKLDPRVDTSTTSGVNQGSSMLGGTTSSGYGSNTTAGPHNSNLANKMDPRVDSDLDGSGIGGLSQRNYDHENSGMSGLSQRDHHEHHGHHGHHGHHHGTTGAGMTGANTGMTGSGYNTNEPVHNSSMLNKLDPRVDTSTTAGGNTTMGSNYGSHQTGAYSNTTTTTDTTGPVHNSSILNKLDPRVDSTATNAGSAGNMGGRSARVNPAELDAAKHGPSAFRQVHGDPTVHHEFPGDATSGRHGSISRSDQHYGSGAA